LGLAIVKKLIELFNSKIEIESAPNEGTTFTFTIGFKESKIKTVENVETNLIHDFITGNVKILVVEDNKINQIVTKKIIEKIILNVKLLITAL